MTDGKVRGSELLAKRWSKKELAALLDVESDGVHLVEVLTRGTPNPDAVRGTWRVERDALPALIQVLIDKRMLPRLRVFPRGIIDPDVFDVEFDAGWRG